MDKLESANFKIMHLTPERLKNLNKVTVLDTYENGTDNFHPQGLFSSEIFGRVGDKLRNFRFGYIDCKIEVMHPLIFKNVLKLKQFYGGIIKGTEYAEWDPKAKDFVKSDPINGQTGYNFFLTHFKEMQFETTGSKQRDQRVKLLETYRDIAMTKHILVMPAGLRDVEIEPDGRTIEGEINEFYRRILAIANTINPNTNINSDMTNSARLGIQNAFNKIYEWVITISRGKGGFILKKWAKRSVFNATRTVLTSQPVTYSDISKSDEYPGWNNTTMGIAQLMKAILPIACHRLKNHELILECFPNNDNNAYLLDPKTLERKLVTLDNRTADKWTTQKGLESLFDDFMEHSVRSSPITIKGYYVGLIYLHGDDGFKFLFDINHAKEFDWIDITKVRPITWIELVYLMGYKEWNTYPVFPTRYPISGAGSIFPSFVFAKTTALDSIRYEVDDEGNLIPENKAISFPNLDNPTYIDSQGVNPSRLEGLGADHDGDTVSGIVVYSEDAIAEINIYLNSAKAYIRPGDGLLNSPYTDPINRVIWNMTGD